LSYGQPVAILRPGLRSIRGCEPLDDRQQALRRIGSWLRYNSYGKAEWGFGSRNVQP